jgi:hypothetical protein
MIFPPVLLLTLLIGVLPVAFCLGVLGWLVRLARGFRHHLRANAEVAAIDWSRFERDLRTYTSPAWVRAREAEQRL